jgi:hypothetical protein
MPSDFSLKGGWQPKGKDGKSKESWRGDFKGIDQIVGSDMNTSFSMLSYNHFHRPDGWARRRRTAKKILTIMSRHR